MRYRNSIVLLLIVILMALIIMMIPPSVPIVMLLHTAGSAFLYVVLIGLKVRRSYAGMLSLGFLLVSLLFVFKLLSFLNLILLLAIAVVGFVYLHTK